MSKPSPRKQKKQKERQRENRTQKLAAAQRQLLRARKSEYAQKYPGFRFDTTNGDPAFVELVKKAVAQINFEDESVFLPWEAEVYQLLKQRGSTAAFAALERATAAWKEDGMEGTELAEVHFSTNLGQAVFNVIGEAELLKYIPFNDVRFYQVGHDISVVFGSLLHAKGSGGTVYYSRKKPAIEIDGEKKIVAFSKHAIDRICDRIKVRWKTYGALGDLFAFLSHCVYFERCCLDGGQLAFSFYDICSDPPFSQHWYVEEVLGEENVDPAKGDCYYRLGYCPAVIEGEFIKAKTLLFPGFASTPEYRLIQKSSLSRQEKQEMVEKTKHLDADTLYSSHDFSLIKWFHDNGVPQVVQLQQPAFDYK
jgi:hypothetical protein